MSETLFRLLLSELTVARIVCVKCGGVAEFPVEKLEEKYPVTGANCHFCTQPLQLPQANGLHMLGRAMRALKQTEQMVEVRFDVKQPKE